MTSMRLIIQLFIALILTVSLSCTGKDKPASDDSDAQDESAQASETEDEPADVPGVNPEDATGEPSGKERRTDIVGYEEIVLGADVETLPGTFVDYTEDNVFYFYNEPVPRDFYTSMLDTKVSVGVMAKDGKIGQIMLLFDTIDEDVSNNRDRMTEFSEEVRDMILTQYDRSLVEFDTFPDCNEQCFLQLRDEDDDFLALFRDGMALTIMYSQAAFDEEYRAAMEEEPEERRSKL